MGECWIEVKRVTSIWPLRGVPILNAVTREPVVPRRMQIVDIADAEVIGCRVACDGHVVDLGFPPDEMAAEVAAARGEPLEPSRAIAAAPGSH